MVRYALLAHPGHNRIYFEASLQFAQQELLALLEGCGARAPRFIESPAGLPEAVCFECEVALDQAAKAAVASSSIAYALFEITADDLLKPVVLPGFAGLPESLGQILKYSGKTNEQFTRLLVNLALSACQTPEIKKTLLDPMCGKGTSLFEGLIRGFDVVGCEINGKWLQELQVYMIRYLKTGRFKHRVRKEKRSRPDGRKIADGFLIETAVDRDDFANNERQSIKAFAADTRDLGVLVKKESCDILVSDLPYGVQHGSKTVGQGKMDRRPDQLLDEALPGWQRALKVGGALAISFNSHSLPVATAQEILARHGFEVLREPPFSGFAHKVDQAILRDLVVARRV
ncbi:TRM11 family SAM-dependent methyltransferase [Polycladidibacter stylochi]|uniref:TRM11 family SAM-dependent methyltransferase n=1 Tax=Polycladidibacter stylochi TaxID=1807766 RepID=UPI00082A8135|nr:DNA methylase [Pseudovibrio stylochi]